MRRKRKPMKAATMMQLGIAGILLIVLVMFIVWYSDGLNSFKPDEATFQYIAGTKVERTDSATYRNKDGFVEISDSYGKNQIGVQPILYKDTAKITLSNNMLLMVPTEGTGVNRINYFTTITYKNGASILTNGGKKAVSYGGFLFDGRDTYIFLEKMTLFIGNNKIELEPLSYVTVYYQQKAEFLNSADGEYCQIGLSNTDVYAVAKDSNYSLDLGKDIIDDGNGEALLYSAVDSAPVIKMGN